ncbi:MAG: hypothetical protein KZQ64_03220 [gamma proteobacterium symbiont of Bathyaustriella thionipta]|nr:hypothetical protein [gamma proteobacterium symbiont of Bathyaustriella thionipta]MCU7948890.1 hypothetical protein [gamma proteobacterium symbiont of Bathyaustriella thionipta]MCU7952392.1 hypothetical protein [gamma proteobacterium symbiont of Bathyaustriella thionipta]MCU7955347.1 hypothetical protein [gamma proteobacterium symbiont of Bathyaustriella thionipta]MCU7966105.1 hypothetical protein [gamma proteobacterium symbiont of Bathyaustriella thionipta]
MSNSPDFIELIASETLKQPTFKITRPPSGIYYIRAKTINEENYSSPYSPAQKIEVAPKSYWPVSFVSILAVLLMAL